MSKRESIARYTLIIKKIRKHPCTFSEIADYLALESELQEYDFNISKRTFQRDIEDIRSVYNIDIQYDFSKRVYHVDFDQQPEVNERIMEAFDIFNALNITDRLSDFIHFEKRKPRGTENLYGLLHAIKNQVQIVFSYQKFQDEAATPRKAEPYALKEFKNRWYVVAKDLKDNKVKTFGLDRLSELSTTKTKFENPIDFNVNEHFKYCFGIISPDDGMPQEVILSFDPFQGKYIKSLPLHESQVIIADSDDELRVKLTIFITYDFIKEILSFGEMVIVIEPEALIIQMKNAYNNALKSY
jgi:predicted DNA-binding transcriptional regulator YafY